MRWRVVGAVIFVFACSYAVVWAVGYSRARLSEAVREIAEQIEVAHQPRFEAKRGTLTLPAGEEKRLRIDNVAGSVEVVPGGPDTVAEYVIYARGEDEADARCRAQAVVVGCGGSSASGNRIWVEAAEGERWPPGASVKLVVTTPPDRDLSVNGVSADVSVRGIQGPIAVKVVSGDVSVRDSAGSVLAHTVSGDVRVEAAGGPVEAGTTSGDVVLSALRGSQVDAHTVSGDVTIEAALPFSGQLDSRSVSGDVCLTLPATSDCEVQASTLSGTISGGPWGDGAGRQASARLNAGTGSVHLSTTSGDIRLSTEG